MKSAWCLPFCMLFLSCTHVPLATNVGDKAAREFRAPPNMANLYIYRDQGVGYSVTFSLLVDGEWIGDTAAHTFLYEPIAPGRHQIISKSEDTQELVLQVEAGINYFIRQEVKMGVMSARSALYWVHEDEGKPGVALCKLAKTRWAMQCDTDAQCSNGRLCAGHACVEPTPVAPRPKPKAALQNCDSDRDCTQGSCFDGACRY